MSHLEPEQPHDPEPSEDPELTPSGERDPDEEEPETGRVDDEADLRGDPVTGSTEQDPNVDTTGLPPAGRDPMAGESPSS